MTYKTEYTALLASGMFYEFYPGLSGEWEKDKKDFVKAVKSYKRKNNV